MSSVNTHMLGIQVKGNAIIPRTSTIFSKL